MTHLCLFARAPRPGAAKTRLAPRLGLDGAARLAAAFVDDVARLSRGAADTRALAVAGDPDDATLVAIARREGIPVVAQAPGDLGARMAAALRDGLGHADRVAIVGTDAPTVTSDMIRDAFALLDDADVALGPADDGGYWIVAARRSCEALFERVAWGTSTVLETSLGRAREAGLTVALAARHFDVDAPADLDRLAAALAADPSLAPATRAVLSG